MIRVIGSGVPMTEATRHVWNMVHAAMAIEEAFGVDFDDDSQMEAAMGHIGRVMGVEHADLIEAAWEDDWRFRLALMLNAVERGFAAGVARGTYDPVVLDLWRESQAELEEKFLSDW